jgi:hypothetical protein
VGPPLIVVAQIIKSGHRGGLTVVLRTCGGMDVDRGMFGPDVSDLDFACNSHLLPPSLVSPANYVVDCDINSLYAASGKKGRK